MFNIGINSSFAVWFNKKLKDEYDLLIKANIVSQPFNEFVKSAYYEKLQSIKLKYVNEDVSHKTIEELTIKKLKEDVN